MEAGLSFSHSAAPRSNDSGVNRHREKVEGKKGEAGDSICGEGVAGIVKKGLMTNKVIYTLDLRKFLNAPQYQYSILLNKSYPLDFYCQL